MRTATGLALIAIGAILAFAVTTSPSFLNLQVVGWILILTGVAGMFVPRRGYGWLRRRVVVRRPRGTAVEANGESRRFRDTRWFRRNALSDPRVEETGSPVAEGMVTESAVERTVPGPGQPAEETVEEYFEE
ncbi:MAG TPA: DUF6458 family protein [Streptosporangiaceae bacterium]|nr:DUF6458 family protein [Streptosporangiaceae bacterium]